MSEIKTDTAGNNLKCENGQWQILKKHVGWIEFVGKTYLTDGTCIDTTPPVQVDDEVIQQANVENDLFIHFAGLAMQGLLSFDNAMLSGPVVESSCDHAQALIDELKSRGKL